MKLKYVDGFKIRNTLDIDFGGIGCREFFSYIPSDEVWLDDIYRNEKDLFIDMWKTIIKNMAKYGYEESKAQFKINYDYDEEKLNKIYHPSGYYLVDGAYVRSNISRTFKYGGHWKVYDYIPEGETWLDDKVKPDEMKYIYKHESTELKLMDKNNFSYNDAHDFANAFEKRMRRKHGAVYKRD